VKTKTLTLPEDLLQLQAELTIMRSECLRMADRCSIQVSRHQRMSTKIGKSKYCFTFGSVGSKVVNMLVKTS
jgi:hypothetical protein